MLERNAGFVGSPWRALAPAASFTESPRTAYLRKFLVRALLDSISPLMRRGLATLQEVCAWSYDEGKSSGDLWLKDDHRLVW